MKFNRALEYSIYAGIFLIPIIPFIVVDSFFFPFITGKAIMFRTIAEVIFGLWIILAVRDKAYRPKLSWIMGTVVVFTLIVFLADIFGENFYRSFWSNFERMEGLVTIFHLAMYFIVASTVLKTEKIWLAFLNTSVGASVIMSFYAIYQLAGFAVINQGGSRVDGTLGNAIYMAIYMLFHIFIILFLIFKTKKTWLRWIYLGAALLNTIILLYTQTRGTVLGLIGGFFVTAILIALFEKNKPVLRKVSAGVLILLVLIVAGFTMIRESQFVKENRILQRFSSLSLDQLSTQGRYYVWPMAIEGFKERPILGWGQENFIYVFSTHYHPQMYAHEPWFDRAHNVILDWLVAGGILGVIGYLMLHATLLFAVWREKQYLDITHKSILTGFIAAYIFHGIFVFDNLISYLLFFSILALVHSLFAKKRDRLVTDVLADEVQQQKANYMTAIAVPVVLILFILTFYHVNIKPAKANVALLKSLSNQPAGIEVNLNYYKKALSYDTFGNIETLEQHALALDKYKTLSPEKQSEVFNLTKSKLLDRLEKDPDNLRLLIFVGSFFNRYGLHDEAVIYLEKAKQISPKKPEVNFELAGALMSIGEFEKALELTKDIHEEIPDFYKGYLMYLIVSIYADNRAVENELLKRLDTDESIANQAYRDYRVISAYSFKKRYNDALSFLLERMSRFPNDSEGRLLLAGAYLIVGNRPMAIQTLEELARTDPNYKNQAEYYISEIRAGRNP